MADTRIPVRRANVLKEAPEATTCVDSHLRLRTRHANPIAKSRRSGAPMLP